MFSIDNTIIRLPAKIVRSAQMTPSEISGMMLDKSYFNDVIGTYMSYTVAVVVPLGKEGLYDILYEILTDPVDAHSFVFPYNQTSINITGRVENVTDELYKEIGGKNIWRKTQFTVIANHPSKAYTLSEMINRGLTPIPNVSEPEADAVYEYDPEQGWIELDAPYPDVDEVAY